MMSSINREIIAEVAAYVLETMVFASSEVAEGVPEESRSDLLLAEIQYQGDRNGGLSIMAPQPLCTEWAIMMTGDDSTDLYADALGEVANVIGGNWLSRSFPAGEKIKLLPPRVKATDANGWASLGNSPNAVLLSVDDSPFMLSVTALD